MNERIVQKTGWQIISDLVSGKGEKMFNSPPVQEVRAAAVKYAVTYNPLQISVGDIVLLDHEDALEIRFVVDRLVVMKRRIGAVEVESADYILTDPTDETVLAVIRAFDDGKGGVSLLLLRSGGDNPYDAQLEQMLNDGVFPIQEDEYKGFVRPYGAPVSHEAEVTEYSNEVKNYKKTYWDFLRDSTLGFPVCIFEMNMEDGFFCVYKGVPLESNLLRAFRY